jgi:ethanolamine utilization protein EutN
MRIGEVIGVLTLSRAHESLRGGRFPLAVPLSLEELAAGRPGAAESLVVYDELGAGPGARIAISEGGEAAQPFYPELKPIDAYNAALLDQIDLPAAG